MSTPRDVVSYFDGESGGWSDRYAGSRHFAQRLATVLEWVSDAESGSELLDYGCGSGVLVAELACRGYHVVGLDVSPGMLEAAAAHLEERGVSGAELQRLEGPQLQAPALSRSYAGVCCLGVLEYVDDEQALLARLAGLVRPGGFLVLSVPNRASWIRRIEGFVYRHPGLFRRLGWFRYATGDESYLHLQRHQFSPQELDRLLQAHGLSRTRLCYLVGPRLLGGLANRAGIGMTMLVEYRRGQ